MSARDKLLQAKYFLEQFDASDALDIARYNWSAFVSAWRSVTYVLQKDYRGHYEQEFDDWYETKQRALRDLPFAEVLLRIRTVSQHEGDTFPLIVISARDGFGNTYDITWDQSKRGNGLVNLNIKLIDGPDGNIDIDSSDEKFFSQILQYLAAELPGLLANTQIELKTLAFDFDLPGISKAEVVTNCRALLQDLETVVQEAEDHFGLPGYILPFARHNRPGSES